MTLFLFRLIKENATFAWNQSEKKKTIIGTCPKKVIKENPSFILNHNGLTHFRHAAFTQNEIWKKEELILDEGRYFWVWSSEKGGFFWDVSFGIFSFFMWSFQTVLHLTCVRLSYICQNRVASSTNSEALITHWKIHTHVYLFVFFTDCIKAFKLDTGGEAFKMGMNPLGDVWSRTRECLIHLKWSETVDVSREGISNFAMWISFTFSYNFLGFRHFWRHPRLYKQLSSLPSSFLLHPSYTSLLLSPTSARCEGPYRGYVPLRLTWQANPYLISSSPRFRLLVRELSHIGDEGIQILRIPRSSLFFFSSFFSYAWFLLNSPLENHS